MTFDILHQQARHRAVLPLPHMRALLAILLALTPLAYAAPNPSAVQTDKGWLEGAPTPDGKVIAFKGIPYAAPPVEELRWKAPTPAAKWKKIRPAFEYGPHCVQFGSYPDMVFHDPGESEDCLTLNVWTPAGAPQRAQKKGSKLLPVMVWIYGGGFVTGSTSESRQDGQFLARRDVVVVSMNYRLGLFGFLALPDLAVESGHNASGNYGLQDQAAALRWVRENIESFGGDPRQCHALRRIRRLLLRHRADGLAALQGALLQGHRRERRSLLLRQP